MSTKQWWERRKPTHDEPISCYVSDYVPAPYQYVERIVDVDADGFFITNDDERYKYADPITPIDQYTYWPGGECPVAGDMFVDFIDSERREGIGVEAKYLEWDTDIIAYRVHVED